MKKEFQPTKKKQGEVTLKDLFRVIDAVTRKASKDKPSQKLIDSAAQKWESDSRYAF